MVSELIRNRPWATEAGTARFARRHDAGKDPSAFRNVAKMTLTSLGIGTYLGSPDDATDARYTDAIVEAVRQGINVIDTASNYRRGRSERCVGDAIGKLVQMREVFRSELLVASKAGFVPLPDGFPDDPDAWFHSQTVGAGLAEPDELRCRCHCIAPRYLAAMVDRSLAATGLSCIDVYYVHNPESQLQEIDRPAFHDRMRAAFAALEEAADAGKIRVYGIATWPGLRAVRSDRDYVSLDEMVQCAVDVAGTRHRFKAIQLPLNPAMPEAFSLNLQPNPDGGQTILDAATDLGLVTFTSAPLYQGRYGHTAVDTLRAITSVPGVTTALAGMSRIDHVRANIEAMSHPPMTAEERATWFAQ